MNQICLLLNEQMAYCIRFKRDTILKTFEFSDLEAHVAALEAEAAS